MKKTDSHLFRHASVVLPAQHHEELKKLHPTTAEGVRVAVAFYLQHRPKLESK
jgi:hypothetical protein